MSLQAISRFLFPNSFFFAESNLLNEKYPWFELFCSRVHSIICDLHSQASLDYPICFEDLAGYTEEEQQGIWKACRKVYDEIKKEKVRDIIVQNAGMSSFMLNMTLLYFIISCWISKTNISCKTYIQ
jgi:hypothetical protein